MGSSIAFANGGHTALILSAPGILILGTLVSVAGLVVLVVASTGSYSRLARHRLGRWLVVPYWPLFRKSRDGGKRTLQLAGALFLVIGVALLAAAVLQQR